MAVFEGLGPALRVLRQRAGLTQRAAVARCREVVAGSKLTQGRLSRWERGVQLPNLAGLGELLEGLGATLSDLVQTLDATLAPAPAHPDEPDPQATDSAAEIAQALERMAARVVAGVEERLTNVEAELERLLALAEAAIEENE